jgi:restriction endonuclease Mrr
MSNIFAEIKDKIFFDEGIAFEEDKIKIFISKFLENKLKEKGEKDKSFYFEEIIYDFFEYLGIGVTKTKKTRDFGLDGVIKLNLDLLGEIDLGLQIKHKLIDSTDVDMFLSALRNAGLQLGVLVCKDSRELGKYRLNSKIKAILLAKGIKIKEKLIKEDIDINPVFVMKMEEIIDIATLRMRLLVKSIYKK